MSAHETIFVSFANWNSDFSCKPLLYVENGISHQSKNIDT